LRQWGGCKTIGGTVVENDEGCDGKGGG